MTEKEKELKSFMQCADALGALDKKSILRVFHMLSIHFEVMPSVETQRNNGNERGLQDGHSDVLIEHQVSNNAKEEKSKTQQKKVRSPVVKDPTYLSDFDFRPLGKDALKDFFGKYKPKSNLENNLIFVYYLQEILRESPVTMSHIYSCYRHIGIKIPSFPQTLVDTKGVKGWIEYPNYNDVKVTRAGINYMEHEMHKNEDQ